MAFVKQVLC